MYIYRNIAFLYVVLMEDMVLLRLTSALLRCIGVNSLQTHSRPIASLVFPKINYAVVTSM